MDEICGNQLTTHTFIDTGIMEFSGKCYLRSKELTIYGQNSGETVLKNAYVPTLNISDLYHLKEKAQSETSPVKLLKYDEDNSLSYLKSQIDSLKNEEGKNLFNIDKHDTHHYILIYSMVCVLVIVLYYLYNFPKEKPAGTDVEMNVIEDNTPSKPAQSSSPPPNPTPRITLTNS